MAIPSVALPVPFEQIPAEIARLSAHAKALGAEQRVTYSIIQAVQDGCEHPKDKQRVHHDYSGGTDVTCGHCGKTW